MLVILLCFLNLYISFVYIFSVLALVNTNNPDSAFPPVSNFYLPPLKKKVFMEVFVILPLFFTWSHYIT